MTKSLVLGSVRSGKTNYAQQSAIESGLPVRLIVTAEALDDEMRDRIRKHQASRPSDWDVIEAPLDLPEKLLQACQPGYCVIVDCLTLWLSNCLCQSPETFETSRQALIDAVTKVQGKLFLVSNEVGWGIVPDNELSRIFRDEAGRLHQQLARCCDEVKLVVAGIPMTVK